jgi:hypothetical protein
MSEPIEISIQPTGDITAYRQDGYAIIIIKESAIRKWTISLAWRIVRLVKSIT